jgi:hypothetical protein
VNVKGMAYSKHGKNDESFHNHPENEAKGPSYETFK